MILRNISTTFNFFRVNVKKILRYGITGIINTIFGYSLFILISNYVDYRITLVLVYMLGIFLSYFLNSKFTFGYKGKFVTFAIIMIMMMLVNMAIVWIFVEFLHIIKEISQLIAVGVVFLLGFSLNKKFAF